VFWGASFLALSAAAVEAREPAPTPLPWRVGGPLGFTVDAAAFPDSAGPDHVLEVYLRLPPSTLASLARSERDEGRIKLSVRLLNRFGSLQHEGRQEFGVVPSDTGAYGKVVVLRFPVKPGAYRMEVRLEDPQSRKRGLAYVGRHVTEFSKAEGELTVLAAVDRRRMSDVEFLWGEAAPGAAAFRRPGADAAFLPNPERLYGLLAPELKLQFVAQASDGASGMWHWRASIVDGRGQAVAQRESSAVAGPRLVQTIVMDLSTEPAGRYEVEVRAWREGDAQPLVRRNQFSVAWRLPTWRRNPRDLEDEMHFLLDRPDDEESFALLSPGEQERFLDDFWRERDPTPGTALNEALDEFRRRVEFANRTWTHPQVGKGMFSDMGRVHIRHGEPSEILRQVVPAGDQTLSQLLMEIDMTEDRPTGEVRSKGLGGDMRPFEVWVYEGERGPGITAKPDPSAGRTRKRLLFLFVDDRGYGDYRLRYTTE
jgi:GWxTD domain-containing protein